MDSKKILYKSVKNPLLSKPERPLPRQVGIIGAGTIGPDIGYYLKSALPDSKLFLVDVLEEPLKKAEKRLNGYAGKSVERGMMKEEQAKKILENITYTTDYEAIKGCDLVIEAATESIPVKQKIFARLESVVRPETIITSNTSSIPAARIFSTMDLVLSGFPQMGIQPPTPDELLAATRKTYDGPVVVGTDLMTFKIDDTGVSIGNPPGK